MNIIFQAVHRSQDPDDTENADSNSKEGKECTELIFPKLQHSHPETARYDLDTATKHDSNLLDKGHWISILTSDPPGLFRTQKKPPNTGQPFHYY